MKNFSPIVLGMMMAVPLAIGLGCKPSAEKRAADATTQIRAMDQELLGAQKTAMAAFKALPDADDIRLGAGANFDDLIFSEKNLASHEEELEKALISIQKDSKDDALIGELRLYAKKTAQGFQNDLPNIESNHAKMAKDLADGMLTLKDGSRVPMPDAAKKLYQQVVKTMPLQEQFQKDSQKIGEAYEAKLSKLLI